MKSLIFLLVMVGTTALAQASEDSVPGDFRPLESFVKPPSLLTPTEAYGRAQAVFQSFGIQPEAKPDWTTFESSQNLEGYTNSLSALDPFKQMPRFSLTNANRLELFSDRDSKQFSEGTVGLAPSTSTSLHSVRGLVAKLKAVAAQSNSALPLQGLRVALDPGHMGGTLWDERTGKYVHDDATGRTISEGVINLQTALLLGKRLSGLGAAVMITHHDLGPVSKTPYAQLNISDFAKEELRTSWLENWFQTLLDQNTSGPALATAFRASSQVKQMYAESARSRYFILEDDLDARSEAIEAFDPDLSLIIHYDAQVTAAHPNGLNTANYDGTKAYVLGGFMTTELATESERADFARHALDAEASEASLKLAQAVAQQISTELSVPKEQPTGNNQVLLEPGVIARNLSVSRKIHSHAMAYVECLYYNNPTEFNAIYKTTHPMQIGGVNVPYSDRVASVATALGDAIIQFLRNYD